MELETFTALEGDTRIVSLVVDLVAYSTGSLADMAPVWHGALGALRDVAGPGLRWWRGPGMTRMRKVDERLWETVDARLGKGVDEHDLHILATSGDTNRAAGGPAFQLIYYADLRAGALRLALPASGQESSDAKSLLALTEQTFSSRPILWGYGGYSVHWNPVDALIVDEAPQIAAPWLRRYPGLAYGDPTGILKWAQDGVIDVNWLTLLGPDLAARIGGADALRASLPKEVIVRPLGDRNLVLQAGNAPDTGDVNRKSILPLYREVGRRLRSLRPKTAVLEEVPIDGLSEENQAEWLDRFFG